eukprot:TRINITY_DN1010_c0_g1_i1.p1 TRINITY_DN1010_c0_g1~~TRINITY_DN1010_c0_g1_i1.p1  ORF type:complete len:110 (-),score=19.53 TRINITY_DN1010_c0_g1_i1:76-405(-)
MSESITLQVCVAGENEVQTIQTKSDAPIHQLKQTVSKVTGLSPNETSLFIKKAHIPKPLIASRTVEDYRLVDNDTIYAERTLVGGAAFWLCCIPCPPPCCEKKPEGNYY